MTSDETHELAHALADGRLLELAGIVEEMTEGRSIDLDEDHIALLVLALYLALAAQEAAGGPAAAVQDIERRLELVESPRLTFGPAGTLEMAIG